MREPQFTQDQIDAMMAETDDSCWQCGGAGGWNSCFEDCCPAIDGEDGCTDPACWRRCDVCRGKGHLRATEAADG